MYREQLKRTARWYSRLAELARGRPHDRPVFYYLDEFYAFFMNCYHLKNWIINDDTVNLQNKKQTVEQFISDNEDLSVCADICNSVKHLKLRPNPRSGGHPKLAGGSYEMDEWGDKTTIRIRFRIDTAKGSKDAYLLAARCVKAWKRFIGEHIRHSP